MKKILIISSSLRAGSNSEILAKEVLRGANDAKKSVEFISLKDLNIKFCIGCLSCQKTGKCAIDDDMNKVINKVKEADVIVFATPVYYYGISGQLKTFLDRCNPLYDTDYKFRDIYLITASGEDGQDVYQKSLVCLQGWVDCFPKAHIINVLSGGGFNEPNEIKKSSDILGKAYKIGQSL